MTVWQFSFYTKCLIFSRQFQFCYQFLTKKGNDNVFCLYFFILFGKMVWNFPNLTQWQCWHEKNSIFLDGFIFGGILTKEGPNVCFACIFNLFGKKVWNFLEWSSWYCWFYRMFSIFSRHFYFLWCGNWLVG